MRVYVAASGRELDRAERAMALLRELGHEITHSWIPSIRRHGADASTVDAAVLHRAALDDLRGVVTADVTWLLAPGTDRARGCYAEAGMAALLGALDTTRPGPRLVISGPYAQHFVFATLGLVFASDTEALAWFAERG